MTMCETVSLADNWKPTVVQLAPFSHSKTKEDSIQVRRSLKEEELRRSYPILAVTRSNSGRSYTAAYSSHVTDAKKEDVRSEYQVPYSGRKPTDFIKIGWIKSTSQESKMRQDREIDLRCSVQNLNDQALPIRDDTSSCKSQTMATESGSQSDNSEKSYSENGGAKRSVKLTPGEMELQRYKENYAREQALKRKKYKLNVNQLPRSTTPINDHDPDKLNMKQVINFLQKKTPKEPMPINKPVQRQSAVRLELHSRKEAVSRERPATESWISRQTHFSTSTTTSDRPVTEIPRGTNERKNSNDQNRSGIVSRDSCPSVLSTRSVPIIDRRESIDSQSKLSSSRSGFEKVNRNRTSKKQNKEFKLYRFLALAPNGQGQTTVPLVYSKRQIPEPTAEKQKVTKTSSKQHEISVPQTAYRSTALREIPLVERKESSSQNCDCVHGSKFTAPQDKTNERKKLNRTANLVHRRVVKQQLEQKRKSNTNQVEEYEYSKKPGPIRLPSVHDYDDDLINYDSGGDEGSDELAEIRSVFSHKLSSEHDSASEHASEPAVTSRSDITSDRLSTLHSNLVFQRLYGNSNPVKTKKISINIPHEEEETSNTNDVIKLTLRQEKFVTPRHSYMHDIAMPRNSRNQYSVKYLEGYQSQVTDSQIAENGFRIDVTVHPQNGYSDASEDQLFISGKETLANSCIKVRQKLKGSNFEAST
ncbi:hypothetical protein FSP39_011210 [Pinctada imbricata]|uniref:Uncharacterized protein n=1 Tax=Pinctada imbricata TaxID=66713 RepID=A0AA88XQG9_PINIB|nr:hypothetical protein FSP39_011210 [Pinctada imbricata]